MDHAALMLELFQGRNDAWGGDEGRAVYGNVDHALMVGHLQGVQPIGTYCCRHKITDTDQWIALPDDTARMMNMEVKWGCCDIDTGDWGEAYLLTRVLDGMGLKPWVERSRSKGWHVWVFSDEWVPAFIMRRCLKVAYKTIDLQAKEANPKSELLRPNQLGNYVRTPYKGTLKAAGVTTPVERQTMMDWGKESDGDPISIDDWLFLQTAGLIQCDNRVIRKWASKWFEPPRLLTINGGDLPDDQETQQLVLRLSRPLKKLWTDGPSSGDTSQGLMALAWNAAKAGWQPADVFKLVAAADMRWGKYSQRPNWEIYITDIVERAYR